MITSLSNLIILSLVVVYVLDYNQFSEKISNFVYRLFTGRKNTSYWIIPLIGCSLCVTWWLTILISYMYGFSILYCLGLGFVNSYLTPLWLQIMLKIRDLIGRI